MAEWAIQALPNRTEGDIVCLIHLIYLDTDVMPETVGFVVA